LEVGGTRLYHVSRMRLASYLLFALVLFSTPSPAWSGTSVSGTVVSALKSSPVSGATVRLGSAGSAEVQETQTDQSGVFSFKEVPPGEYEIQVIAAGFKNGDSIVRVGQEPVSIEIALELASPAEEVRVEGQAAAESEKTDAGETVQARLVDLAPLKGDNFQALLPLMPGLLRAVDGRISFKGAQPTQSALLVGTVDATDIATGNFGYELPIDAVESVDILPNPYSSEFGRFSSGVARVETRRGDNLWRYGLNNFIPRPKWRDGHLMGFGSITPRLTFRGPLLKDRLHLAQSLRYMNIKTRVRALPDLQNDTRLEAFESFTRLDAALSDRHSLTTTVAVFPRKLDFVNLNTFNPQPVSPNFHQRGYAFTLSLSSVLSATMTLDSVAGYKSYDVDIFGQGDETMVLAPEQNRGNFFNRQARRTTTFQWAEGLTTVREGPGGSHLLRGGIDVLHAQFDGASGSHPVVVLGADGRLKSRIEFTGPSSQRVRSTELAFFGQDRWRLNDRLMLDLGLRIDRDGVLSRLNTSPRLGFALGVLPEGQGILRGGAGFFFGRTPLNVAAFSTYERQIVTSLSEPEPGNPLRFDHIVDKDLRSPYGLIWNLEYDHRLTKTLLLKVNHFRRSGLQEMIVEPFQSGDVGFLTLSSRGRSRYRETEVSFRYYRDEEHKLVWSYVRSRSEADLNAFDLFFGNFRNPIIRDNEFSLTPVDVPNRLVWRGAMLVPYGLLLAPVLEIRNGFPYSRVDENLDFVGSRNRGGRFPRLTTLDLSVTRQVKFRKWKPRVGFRVYNLFNSFAPRDVQNNVDSPVLGSFYNPIPRSWGGTLQFEP